MLFTEHLKQTWGMHFFFTAIVGTLHCFFAYCMCILEINKTRTHTKQVLHRVKKKKLHRVPLEIKVPHIIKNDYRDGSLLIKKESSD